MYNYSICLHKIALCPIQNEQTKTEQTIEGQLQLKNRLGAAKSKTVLDLNLVLTAIERSHYPDLLVLNPPPPSSPPQKKKKKQKQKKKKQQQQQKTQKTKKKKNKKKKNKTKKKPKNNNNIWKNIEGKKKKKKKKKMKSENSCFLSNYKTDSYFLSSNYSLFPKATF